MRNFFSPVTIVFSLLCFSPSCAFADQFCFRPPGKLNARDAASGDPDRTIFVPAMTFPLKVGSADQLHAHLNSQIFGYGGMYGPGGALSDPRNYAGCWEDTFCEGKRSWKMPLCPSHIGHQGDDIRPNGPEDSTYEAVAFEDGYIRLVTKNTTVVVAGDDGTECRYLHMDPNSLKADQVGMRVSRGAVIGKVSNWMNGVKNGTSTHLHFDCSQVFDLSDGNSASLHIPVYTSLVLSYAFAWNLPGLSTTNGELAPGSAYERP